MKPALAGFTTAAAAVACRRRWDAVVERGGGRRRRTGTPNSFFGLPGTSQARLRRSQLVSAYERQIEQVAAFFRQLARAVVLVGQAGLGGTNGDEGALRQGHWSGDEMCCPPLVPVGSSAPSNGEVPPTFPSYLSQLAVVPRLALECWPAPTLEGGAEVGGGRRAEAARGGREGRRRPTPDAPVLGAAAAPPRAAPPRGPPGPARRAKSRG